MVKLNENLATKQKITQEQRDNLQNLYTYMDELLHQANSEKEMTPELGKHYTEKMKNLEFKLQENWNFPQDALCHTWWNRFKACSCPVLDNNERFGHEKIINCGCDVHKFLCTKS